MPRGITFLSDKCQIHDVEMMEVHGQAICYKCGLEWEEAHLMNKVRDDYYRAKDREKYNMLERHSLLPDPSLKQATFETFVPQCSEEVANKELALDCVRRIRGGDAFNVIFQGIQGTGKSHLAYSMLKELNETTDFKTSSLFVSIEDMLRKIKGSFSDKNSKYTEDYLGNLLSKPDHLVLDDLGAETGAIDSDKSATDFVQRILYAITTYRQGKVTILTTNLSGKSLFKVYDQKLVSRLLNRPKYIVFKEAEDKRISNIPF